MTARRGDRITSQPPFIALPLESGSGSLHARCSGVVGRSYAERMTTLQPEMVTRLTILATAVEMANRKSAPDVGGSALLEALPASLGVTAGDLEDHVRLMEQRGLAKGVFSFAGLNAVMVKPAGKDLAAQFERDRRDPVARHLQLQDDYLRWLYVCIEIDEVEPTADAFLNASAGYLGLAYTGRELAKATSSLRSAELLASDSLSLTVEGRKAVEHGRSVRDLDRRPLVSHVTTTVTGSTNVTVGSSHVTQTATVPTSWSEDVERLLALLSESLVALPSEVGEAIVPLVQDARDAAREQSPSRAKRALDKIAEFLGATASGALGGHLASQIPAVVALLG